MLLECRCRARCDKVFFRRRAFVEQRIFLCCSNTLWFKVRFAA